jgi:hypothetical protein
MLLPVITLLTVGLITLEVLAMSVCSIVGLGALVTIYVNLLLGGITLVTFLVLRIAGLFVVDSLFRAEHLDERFGTWLRKGNKRGDTRAGTKGETR